MHKLFLVITFICAFDVLLAQDSEEAVVPEPVAAPTPAETHAAKVLRVTTDILSGQSTAPAASVINDALSLSTGSEDPEIQYCAIALAAYDNGENAASYSYPLASLFFRDPGAFMPLFQRLPEDARASVIKVLREGSKSVVGSQQWKDGLLAQLGGN